MTPSPAAKDAARILNRYARGYSAGAFATPTAKDMEQIIAKGGWHEWPGVRAASTYTQRDSKRRDWTGRDYGIPADSRIITHMAVEGGAKIPDLAEFARIYAYAEDGTITGAMEQQGRERCAVRISAASEIINCWGRPGSRRYYAPWDRATLMRIHANLPDHLVREAALEADHLRGWHDDFPFYSDGSWDALNLRGFNPADPTWGIKPSEMSKTWHKEHPEAARLYATCQWTVLAEQATSCVTIAGYLMQITGAELERVRLLRMRAVPGQTYGTLSRHTDITDRAAGTRDGQITRFHIPLITHKLATMSAWNLRGEQATVHLKHGEVWYLDARKPHAVTNASGVDRIHLVIDLKTTPQIRDMLSKGQEMAA